MDYEALVSGLKFDEKGLIPVVVQDYVTHEVLTLAYMNRESLKITLEEKRTCFYSRSRQCLWRKGETTYLFEKGRDKILKKVGEECTEVLIGGAKGDKAETTYELGDLIYHAMVLMVEMGISLEDVVRELARRHVIDKKVKQERMQ